MKRPALVSAAAVVLLGLGSRAQADIALLSTGTTLKVTAQRRDGAMVVLSLKGGGEVGVAATELRGVVPDEVLDFACKWGHNRASGLWFMRPFAWAIGGVFRQPQRQPLRGQEPVTDAKG